LGAPAPWGKRKQYLGQADDKVSIRHDAQITCPGEFCADGKRGAIERRNEEVPLAFIFRKVACRASSGLYPLIKDHLAGGASRLAALLLP
jgi:hypothetical protein